MPVTTGLGRLRQEDGHELQTSLSYIARFPSKQGRGGKEKRGEKKGWEGRESP